MNVLIVDDSSFARSIIKRALEITGIENLENIEAGSGQEALKILDDKNIDFIFTDLNMPDGTGEELIQELKSRPETADIPIIVISSLSNDAKIEKLLSENVTAVLEKPISLPKMIQVLSEELAIM